MSIHKEYATQVFQQRLEHFTPDSVDEDDREERRKRPVPLGLSKRDQEVLISVRRGYHFLDERFQILGLYFGWSFIFAFFVPVIGPTLDYILSYALIIRRAERADVPGWMRTEMFRNLLIGVVLSMIPFVGRVVSALFGPNSRNEMLFEELVRVRGDAFIRLGGSGALVGREKVEVEGEGEKKKKKKGGGDDGWWKVLVEKAGGETGVSRRDAEEVRPGAGFSADEVRQPLDLGGDDKV